MADPFFGLTDPGKLRDNNEDVFIAQTLSNHYILACVIDGVGGYEGGEIAAAIARETILAKLQEPFADAIQALKEAITEANKNIYTEKQKPGSSNSMACVLTVALAKIGDNIFYYAHVGDTRLYLLRDGSLVKVTKDHSFVGFLEDSGRLSEREAMQHPKRNEINKALGFDKVMEADETYIETGSSPFLPGDVLLLCSDGLTDMVTNRGMADVLLAEMSLEKKGAALIAAANQAGGKDNITAVIVTNDKKPLKQKATKPVATLKKNESSLNEELLPLERNTDVETPVEKKRPGRVLVLLLSVLCLILGGTSFWLWQQNKELTKPVAVASARQPNSAEKKLGDSASVASNKLILSDSVFGKVINIGDTIFIRQDSLHLIGNGIILQNDSSYKGPAFFITANCKYLLLENIRFQNFATAIVSQSKGLQLKNVVFQNTAVPVQRELLLPLNDTLTGLLKDSFLLKKDSTHK